MDTKEIGAFVFGLFIGAAAVFVLGMFDAMTRIDAAETALGCNGVRIRYECEED